MCTGCTHDSDNAKIMVQKGWIVYWCWRAGKATKIEKFRKATAEERRVMEYHRQERLSQFLKYEPPYFVELQRYQDTYLRPFDPNKRIQVAWSPMDTGKTYQICEFIKNGLANGTINSFLFLSTRCKFAKSIEGGLKRRGIDKVVNYLDHSVEGKDHIIISTESLHHITQPYDLVILDEVTSCLTQMNSGLHKENLNINRDVFESLVRDCKYVIAMDADIDDRAITFLHNLCPNERICLQHNTLKKREGWTIKRYLFEPDWYSQICTIGRQANRDSGLQCGFGS